MIQLTNVTKHYPQKKHALSEMSFSIACGETLVVTGASGSGKSTLFKLIAMLELPSSGQILINHQNLAQLNKRQKQRLRRQIGIISQTPQLIEEKTVFDNIALPLMINNYRNKEIKRRVFAAIDRVQLSGKAEIYPSALSIGEQRLIEIARAIINKPILLIADEPTAHLDNKLTQTMIYLFKLCRQAGITVLVTTHQAHLAQNICDRVIILEKGKILSQDEQHAT